MFPGPDATAERLQGSVERVTFHSPESGFCVLRIKVRGQRDLVTVIGSAASITAGEYVECSGAWTNDRQHGLQFKAQQLQVIPPSTLEGIEKYLGSGMVKGIGPHFAKKLVRAFGEQVFDVIEQEPDRLLALEGIGPKRKARVTQAWAEQKVVREIMVFLQSHGVGTARAVRIYKTYGDQAVERVQENPYRLALDIHGIGFRTADAIAQRLGIPRDALMRAQAGVRHVLQEIAGDGHCAAYREGLVESAAKLLEIPAPIIEQAIEEELALDNLVAEPIQEKPAVFLTPLHRSERGIAEHIHRLAGVPSWGHIDTTKAVPWVAEKTGLSLSESQRKAEDIHDKLIQVVTERIPKRFGFDPIADVQVLTPMNRGGLGARSLNVELQQRLNPSAKPRVTRFGWTYAAGDKVIQTVNNYDKDVFNGDIGRVARIDEEEGLVFIDYDGRRVEYETGELDEVSLAYATTVHKSQGSEYPAVVIPLAMQHYMLLERNLLYTAVTRGKKLVVVIGQTKALAMAVKRLGSVKRLTNLQHRLHQSTEGQAHGI